MNKVKEKRKQKAICVRCQSPDYTMESPEWEGGKPLFRCGQCSNTWMYGSDGGKYAELA